MGRRKLENTYGQRQNGSAENRGRVGWPEASNRNPGCQQGEFDDARERSAVGAFSRTQSECRSLDGRVCWRERRRCICVWQRHLGRGPKARGFLQGSQTIRIGVQQALICPTNRHLRDWIPRRLTNSPPMVRSGTLGAAEPGMFDLVDRFRPEGPSYRQSVCLSGRAAEEGGFLIGGVPGGKTLKRVPQDLVAARAFV